MGRMGQIFGKNGILLGQKSALAFLLVLAIVFSEGCSRKMPCPDVNKATAKAKKQKKAKKVKVKTIDAGEDGGDGSEAAVETPTEETAEASTEKKPNLSTNKNKYNKNGLLQKKKYKRLRSNPGNKQSRKGNFFSRLFSGGGKSKSKSKAKRTQSVEPVAE
jgi:hypothetical protein